MFSQRNSVGRVMLGGSECPDVALPLSGMKNLRAVEFDPLHRRVYWMGGGRTHSIRYLGEGGRGAPGVLVEHLDNPVDMALDAIGRTMYWTCAKTNTINVTKLDNTSSIGVVVQGEGMMPRYLALHQTKR